MNRFALICSVAITFIASPAEAKETEPLDGFHEYKGTFHSLGYKFPRVFFFLKSQVPNFFCKLDAYFVSDLLFDVAYKLNHFIGGCPAQVYNIVGMFF